MCADQLTRRVLCVFGAAVFAILGFGVISLGGSHAEAASQYSRFSSLNLDRCKKVRFYADSGSAEWSCPGYRRVRLRVVEGDLRFAIGYGRNWKRQNSMTQFLSPFNTIGKTMEWRVRRGRPEASIVRYFTDTGDGRKGQILVVTKVGKKNACHMGYVDARANRRANALARRIAQGAPRFRCGRDTARFLGKRGVSPF